MTAIVSGLFAPKVERIEWRRDALINMKQADKAAITAIQKELLPFLTPLVAGTYHSITKPFYANASITASAVPKTPITDGLWPIVELMQDAALPAFVCLALYGAYEWVLDHKEGKTRIWRAIMAYISVFIIPIGFRAVQVALGGITF